MSRKLKNNSKIDSNLMQNRLFEVRTNILHLKQNPNRVCVIV